MSHQPLPARWLPGTSEASLASLAGPPAAVLQLSRDGLTGLAAAEVLVFILRMFSEEARRVPSSSTEAGLSLHTENRAQADIFSGAFQWEALIKLPLHQSQLVLVLMDQLFF